MEEKQSWIIRNNVSHMYLNDIAMIGSTVNPIWFTVHADYAYRFTTQLKAYATIIFIREVLDFETGDLLEVIPYPAEGELSATEVAQ